MAYIGIEEETIRRPLLNESNQNNVEDTIERINTTGSSCSSITLLLVFTTFVAVSGSFGQGCAIAYSSMVESEVMEDLSLSVTSYSMFASLFSFGGMVGALFSGTMADIIGRKRTLWSSALFCAPGWLAIAFAKDIWWLDAGRLAIGFASGLMTFVIPIYIVEITPKDVRGRFASANQLVASCGFALVYFLGNLVSWRILALTGVIPCVIQIIGLFFVPESPRWLAKMGKEVEFETALQQLRGKTANISQEANDIQNVVGTSKRNSSHEVKTLELFQRKYAYPMLVGLGLMLLQQLGGTGVIYYSSAVFAKANFSTVIGTTVISVTQVPLAATGLFLIDTLGRRTLLMVCAIGAGLSMLLIALAFHLQQLGYLKELTPTMVFIGILGYFSFFIIGILGTPWVIISEILPINIKGTGGSIMNLCNSFSGWLVTFTFNLIFDWSPQGSFLLFAAMCALLLIFVWAFVPETNGLTLEEIQATIASSNHHFDK